MKKLIYLIGMLIIASSCSTTKNTLPFAPKTKYGKYPTKKNKPARGNYSWTYKQWGHEGR